MSGGPSEQPAEDGGGRRALVEELRRQASGLLEEGRLRGSALEGLRQSALQVGALELGAVGTALSLSKASCIT